MRYRLPLALRTSRSYAGRYPSEPAAASRTLCVLPHRPVPAPICCRHFFPPDRPNNGLPSALHGFTNVEVSLLRTLKTIQRFESVRYMNWSYGSVRLLFPSVSLPLPCSLGYRFRLSVSGFSIPHSSLLIPHSPRVRPMDYELRFRFVHFSLERR